MDRGQRPPSGPRCKHDIPYGSMYPCRKCGKENNAIKAKVQPLVDLFWNSRGRNSGDLEDLMYRAYKMGMKATLDGSIPKCEHGIGADFYCKVCDGNEAAPDKEE